MQVLSLVNVDVLAAVMAAAPAAVAAAEQLDGSTVLMLAVACALAYGASYYAWSVREAAAASTAGYAALTALSAFLAVVANAVIWDLHGPAAATLLLVIALALAGLQVRSRQARSSRSSRGTAEGGTDKGHGSTGSDPLGSVWGVGASAAAVGMLLWLLAVAASAALTSNNPTVSHSRQQLEQEFSLVTSELTHLKDQADKWEQAVEHIAKADALYYHVPSFSGPPIAKRHPNQLRLAMSLESASYYAALDDPQYMCQFDAEMTYRQCAQVTNWYSLESMEDLFKMPLVAFEEKEHAIAYINSNCDAMSGRSKIMKDLIALSNSKVPVHSYGSCEHNKHWPTGNPSKRQVFSKYKFCVTMENSLAHDYVTEKLWDGLAAGCVPIYLGTPSALNMAPDASSVIVFDPQGKGNASTVEQLDALMHEIGSSKGRYEKMLAWKHRKVEEQPSALFKYLWSVRNTSGECFLCQFLARHRVNPKAKYTTCLFNETWMAAAGQKLELQPGCE
ncbi:hypothetical protein COO60DRAFT_1691955 [Scenedesmus sp. NREL 46B-D3]|nr:hypothetical protein COO60DRAFT_1691955 [Scenedesmus sp. NREL 46B-D3]